MVRIIKEENKTSEGTTTQKQLTYKQQILLNVLGLLVAAASGRVRQLLENYSIELSKIVPDEELAELLIYAIGERDAGFNRDLASLVLDYTLNSSYDDFDVKAITQGAKDLLTGMGDANTPAGAGILNGLISNLDEIGAVLVQGTQQKTEAGNQTRSAILAYKAQQETKPKTVEESNNNNLLITGLIILVGIGIIAAILHFKKQAHTKIQIA